MKNILCYGDSNTWGSCPETGQRFDRNARWTGVMQNSLKGEACVIEEGLRGRTTGWDNPLSEGKNGLQYLPIALKSHEPLDLIILMLGTNDLKMRFNLTPFTIAQGIEALIECVRRELIPSPKILVVAPALIVETSDFENSQGFASGARRSKELAPHYKYFAEKHGCSFFDAASVITSSTVDGIHLDSTAHRKLGEALTRAVRGILWEK